MQPQDIRTSNVYQNGFSNYINTIATASAMQNQNFKNLQDSIKDLSDEINLYQDKKDYKARLAGLEAKEQERYEYERNYIQARDKKAHEQWAKNFDLQKKSTQAQIARSQSETKSVNLNTDLRAINASINAGMGNNQAIKMLANTTNKYTDHKINAGIDFGSAKKPREADIAYYMREKKFMNKPSLIKGDNNASLMQALRNKPWPIKGDNNASLSQATQNNVNPFNRK